MRILAIDQSLSGFAICDYLDGAVKFQDVIKSKLTGVERLNEIIEKLDVVFVSGQETGGYDIVVFEGYSFGSKGRGVFSIAELGGVMKMFFFKKGVKPIIVPPTVLKKFVIGKGIGPKEVMLKEVFKKWNFDTSDNNLADAYSLMKFGEAVVKISRGEIQNFKKSEIDVVNSWKKSKMAEKLDNEVELVD
jgi:Holliday junction resolvasome RuvABC endonuclease subunit